MAKKKIETPKVEVEETFVELNNTPNPEEVIENLKNVNVDINVVEPIDEKIVEEINKTIEPLKQISEEIESIQSNEEELANKLSENPEVAKEYITNEIKKAEAIADKLKKIINKPETNVTNWWNGMGYDM